MSFIKLAKSLTYLNYSGFINFQWKTLFNGIVKDFKEHMLEDMSPLMQKN